MKSIILTLACLLAMPQLTAQRGPLTFTNFGREEGLPSNTVNDLLRDRQGYLWAATNYGLHRFDGYRFRCYLPQAENGVNAHVINRIIEDKRGRIWLGTKESGAVLFDRDDEAFTLYYNDPRHLGISHNNVTDLAETADGRIIATTNEGYNVYDEEGHRFEQAHFLGSVILPADRQREIGTLLAEIELSRHNAAVLRWAAYAYLDDAHARRELQLTVGEDAARIWPKIDGLLKRSEDGNNGNYDNITAVYADADGSVYFGHYGGGLSRLRVPGQLEVLVPNANAEATTRTNEALRIIRHGDRLLVARLEAGVLAYDLGDKRVVPPGPDQPAYPKDVSVYDLKALGDELYFATPGGVYTVDATTGKQSRIFDVGIGGAKIVAYESASVLPEADGTVWVGHFRSGLSRGTPPPRMTTYPGPGEAPLPHYMKGASTMLRDGNGKLWVGYFEGGIRKLDGRSLKEERIYLTTGDEGIKRSSVFALFEDSRGRLWAGGYASGLIHYLPATDRWEQFPADPSVLGGVDVRSVKEDSEGYLWLSVHGHGLVRLDPNSGVARHFTVEESGLPDHFIFDLEIDDQDRIWFVSISGVSRLERDRETITTIVDRETARREGVSTRFHSLERPGEGDRVWALSGRGMLAFSPTGEIDREAVIPPRLLSESVYGLLASKRGENLWLTTPGRVHRYHPTTGSLLTYPLPDHLDIENFMQGAGAETEDGRLLFGYTGGFLGFRPGDLRRPAPADRPEVSELVLYDDNEALSSAAAPERLEMNSDNTGLSLRLTTFDLSRPTAIRYEARLLPRQTDWRALEGEHPVYTLQHLPPGSHRLEYRATADNGIAYSPVGGIDIDVSYPWYATNLAYLGYFLLLLFGGMWYRSFVKRRERLKQSVYMERLEKEKTRELAREKERFFVNVSHEFRTPLTLINGPLAELRRNPGMENGKRGRYYDIMARSTDRLQRLVDRLLHLQRIENSEPNLHHIDGDLTLFLTDMLEPFRHRAELREIELDVSLPELLPMVSFSPELYDRVCGNLLSNALKYTPRGGRVSFRVLPTSNEQLLIEVEDTGPGIAEADRYRLFERFYRADGSERARGSGIGLAIVKESVALLGGEIEVSSRLGEGTLFRCQLPLKTVVGNGSSVGAGQKVGVGEWAPFERPVTVSDARAILVADDDPDIRALIVNSLGGDYDIIEAADGTEALALARDRQPDLVLTDLMMPGLDGIELCKAIKEDVATSHLPVLLLTARYSDDARRTALRAGANDYLTKPFEPAMLADRIENLLATLGAARTKWVTEPTALVEEEMGAVNADRIFLTKLRDFVEERMDDAELSTDDLLRELGVSRSVCYAKVKALTGLPLRAFVKQLRIAKARQLLEETELSVSEVSHRTGFKTTQHFSRTFKDITGNSPTDFRRKLSERPD